MTTSSLLPAQLRPQHWLLAISSLTWLSACQPDVVPVPERRPPAPAKATDSLYSSVAGAKLEGEAAIAAANTAETEVRTLLKLDFEDGVMTGLSPVSNDKEAEKKLKGLVQVIDAPDGAGKVLKIPGGLAAAASVRTPPIPVEPRASYTLTYSVRTEGLEGPTGARFRLGTAEPLFYSIPPYNHNPADAINNEEKRQRNGVRGSNTARGPEKQGTTAWSTHTIQFTAPAKATYMTLSFDHTRTAEDKGVGKPTQGEVYFDNLTLTATDRPLNRRYGNPDDLNATPHPLQLRVEQPAEDRGAETRYALFAPAPSQLRFERTLPENATLSLGAAVLREGWLGGRGTVTFKVNVLEADGKRETVWEKSLQPGVRDKERMWQDALIDLSGWAGKKVKLELETLLPEGAKAGDYPGAAAVWGDPVLYSQGEGGRLVVLTVIDTASANRMSTYGAPRDTTPNLTRIGQGGVIFEQAYSAAPWTLPSFASIFTGVDAVRHGAGERAWGEVVWRRPLPERFVTLAEKFRAQGFQTVGFVNNPYLTSTFGLGQGFTTYLDYGLGTRTGAGETGVNHALEWLKTHRGYDRFVLVHLMDAHGPYRPPSAWAKKYSAWFYKGQFEGEMGGQDYLDLAEGKLKPKDKAAQEQVKALYDGGLAYTDFQTGRLYDEVQKLAGTQDVTFVITSDHGEELFDHGGFDHGHQAYQELLWVPLIMQAPAYFDGGKRIAEPVRLVDVLPTLADQFQLGATEGIDGLSLMPLLEGKGPAWPVPRDIFAENQLYGSAQNTVRRGPWKYLYNMENTNRAERRPKSADRHELYQLEQDPTEQKNVATGNAETLQQLHTSLDKHLRPMMAGRYVFALDGGGQEKTFTGTIKLPVGASWFRHYEDLIAPLADGKAGALQVVMRGQQLQFSVKTSRALLAFTPQTMPEAGAGIELALAVDGTVWTEGILTGNGQPVGTGLSAMKLADEQLKVAPEALPDPMQGKVSLYVARTTERAISASQQEALPAETEERLRALGYIQ
ncbi:MAG: sulfatase [Myxococcota bacterium]